MAEEAVQESTALDKKYRPQSFGEMVGNPELIMTIQSILSRPTGIPSSFLLDGPSGCGKTTLSRIIAKELGGTESTIKEYNVSNMTGIDTARKIIDHARFKPFGGKKKIYVLNECFSGGTIITGPNNYSTPIEKVMKGDVVFNLEGSTEVKDTFKNKVPLDRIIRINIGGRAPIFCSREHLFFTEDGWKQADQLTKNDLIFEQVDTIMDSISQSTHFNERSPNGIYLSSMQRVIQPSKKVWWSKETLLLFMPKQVKDKIGGSKMFLRKNIYHQTKWKGHKTILQPILFSAMETITPWIKRKIGVCWKNWWDKISGLDKRKSGGLFQKDLGEDDKKQSWKESGSGREDKKYQASKWNLAYMERNSWWEWIFNRAAEAPCLCFGMGDGSSGGNRETRTWKNNQVFNRYCQSKAEDRYRSGRPWASIEDQYRTGQKENQNVRKIRVESSSVYQRGSNDGYFKSVVSSKERDQGFAYFYDLQINGHPSYYANGILVHNCHRASPAFQNAMLEILEEPPSYVHFILCTTDPQKLLKTIQTRCTRLTVKALRSNEAITLLTKVSLAEGVEVGKEVLSKIAQSCEGSPRQALVMLDAVIDCDPGSRLECVNKFSISSTNTLILCQALLDKKAWGDVAQIILSLENEAEETRLGILTYMEKILLQNIKGKPGQKHLRAWEIIEAMAAGMFYRRAQLTAKCFELINS